MTFLFFIPYLKLLVLGLAAGTVGTIVGLGGAFIIMPALLLLYPRENADLLTGVSLIAVFFNALSGSAAYARMKRVDYRSGTLFAVATIPGAILGAISTTYVPRSLFDPIFGSLLIIVAAILLARPSETRLLSKSPTPGRFSIVRRLTDAQGEVHEYSFNWSAGVTLSIAVGYVSSLLGIGGGIIHVPALTHLFGFPVHIATATSHFILAITALAGASAHIAAGTYFSDLRLVVALVIGVILGAQIGARFSQRLQAGWIIRGLALVIVIAGLRIVLIPK
jgi:uncharacterized membrane protein YfcA